MAKFGDLERNRNYRVISVVNSDLDKQDFDEHSEAVDHFKVESERLQGLRDRNELDDGSVELSIILDQFNVGGE